MTGTAPPQAAGLDVDAKYPFQTLCLYTLWVQVMAAWHSTSVFSCSSSNTLDFAPLPRAAFNTKAQCLLLHPKGVTAHTPMVEGQFHPRLRQSPPRERSECFGCQRRQASHEV